jgi:phosphomannomutase
MQEEGISDSTVAGMLSTPTLYYLGQYDFDLAVSITASHNPGEYVGMKFIDRQVELLSTEFLRELFEKEYFEAPYTKNFPVVKGKMTTFISEKMKKLNDFLLAKWGKLGTSYNFVVDFSNGAGVGFEQQFFTKIAGQHSISFLNAFPDGTFSAHESDTSSVANYHQLVHKVQES